VVVQQVGLGGFVEQRVRLSSCRPTSLGFHNKCTSEFRTQMVAVDGAGALVTQARLVHHPDKWLGAELGQVVVGPERLRERRAQPMQAD